MRKVPLKDETSPEGISFWSFEFEFAEINVIKCKFGLQTGILLSNVD
jgi:hypothetical protein